MTRKIAVYSGDIPSTTFIERLIQGLAEEGNTIYLFGKQKKDVNYPANVKVIAYSSNTSKLYLLAKYYLLLLLSRPKDLKQLKAICREKYNDRYFHALSTYIPVLYYRPDIFHIQWAKAIADWIWLKEFNKKIVVSLRGAHINYSPITIPGLADIYRKYFPLADGFHAVSNAIGYEAEKYGAHSIKTVYSGLNLENFPFKTKTGIAEGKIKILSIGRWHWKKGYDYAIDAMRLLSDQNFDFHYTIIGGAATEEAIFSRDDMGLNDKITFVGSVPHNELKEYMYDADIFLLPSVEEGIANVVLEAMAYGTIVITTDCGGMAEAVQDKKNGFIIPMRSSEAIAGKITEVAALDKEQLNTVAIAARKTIEDRFVSERMAGDMTKLYESVLER
ncbi:MAG: glycosyltransferase family 4 protein [Bacteroidetes bacterium]|nr:glycosyltransferase family 4 protein [Bacteroidota bacterium]